jgi:hypothetical protein
MYVTRKVDDKQTFDNGTHHENYSEPLMNLKFDRDISSEVQTGSEVRQGMKEENPTNRQSSSLARTPSQREIRDEVVPVVKDFSIERWISKRDMGKEMSPAEQSFPIVGKISSKRDIGEELPAIEQRWSIEAVKGAEFGTPLEVDAVNRSIPVQPRRKLIARAGFFERVKQKLQP